MLGKCNAKDTMHMYLKDVLYMMTRGQILLVHVSDASPDTFLLAARDKAQMDKFYEHICRETRPYLKVTRMSMCKFAKRAIEVWCE